MSNYPGRTRGDSLVAFFVLTFAITWGIAVLLVLFPGPLEALFGPLSKSSPLFVLAVAAPTIAATILTAARDGGAGLRALYARLLQWRFGLRWYAVALVGSPLLGYLVSRVAGPELKYDLSTPALLFGLLLNQLILGAIWGVWHLPAFFVSGLPQTGLVLPVFLLNILCLSIVTTWLFLHTGGSVLSAALLHYTVNCALDVLGAPLLPFTLAMAVATALVLLLDRRLGWFGREEAQARPAAASA